jgi:hypothetical protein
VKLRHSILGVLLTVTASGAPADFREIYSLAASNLVGVTKAQLDAAAVKGLLTEFAGRLSLGEAPDTATNNAEKPLARSTVYENSFVYFRIGKVAGDLSAELRQAWQALTETNKDKIKGVVLDLRFADGQDYAAAGAAADCFLTVGEPLLEWPGGSANSTKKDEAISVPVALLVNGRTAGAAEALAAVLRATDRALTIGGKTAGQASVFKEFTLANGQKLRVATAEIRLAGGPSLAEPLTPDIPVDSTLADDQGHVADPYKDLHADTNATAAVKHPGRRFNEAELVREQRAGLNPGEDVPNSLPPAPTPPLLADPALARALDLLKGLSALGNGRPG